LPLKRRSSSIERMSLDEWDPADSTFISARSLLLSRRATDPKGVVVSRARISTVSGSG
jgi:hypothetical protein